MPKRMYGESAAVRLKLASAYRELAKKKGMKRADRAELLRIAETWEKSVRRGKKDAPSNRASRMGARERK